MRPRLRDHGCSFVIADLVTGQIVQCPFCLQPARVESADPPWVVSMSRREIRRWRKSRSTQ